MYVIEHRKFMFMFVRVVGSNYKFVKRSDIRREDNYSDIFKGELYRNLASDSILQVGPERISKLPLQMLCYLIKRTSGI